MSDYARQVNGTLRVTIRQAAHRFGVTEAAIRKRIQRGCLDKERGSDGRVYVYLDLLQDMPHSESQVHRDPLVEELVEELRDRVTFLERALERRSIEAERYQQIVAGLRRPTTSSPLVYKSWRPCRSRQKPLRALWRKPRGPSPGPVPEALR
jgi:hypothetical protein